MNVELVFVLRVTIILLLWELVLNWQIEAPILHLHILGEELFEVFVGLNRVDHLQELGFHGDWFLLLGFLDLLLSSEFLLALLIIEVHLPLIHFLLFHVECFLLLNLLVLELLFSATLFVQFNSFYLVLSLLFVFCGDGLVI